MKTKFKFKFKRKKAGKKIIKTLPGPEPRILAHQRFLTRAAHQPGGREAPTPGPFSSASLAPAPRSLTAARVPPSRRISLRSVSLDHGARRSARSSSQRIATPSLRAHARIRGSRSSCADCGELCGRLGPIPLGCRSLSPLELGPARQCVRLHRNGRREFRRHDRERGSALFPSSDPELGG